MGTLRKMKRRKITSSPVDPLNPIVLNAYNKGYDLGAKHQKEACIETTVKFLETLEEIPRIGPKLAWEIRQKFLDEFGK